MLPVVSVAVLLLATSLAQLSDNHVSYTILNSLIKSPVREPVRPQTNLTAPIVVAPANLFDEGLGKLLDIYKQCNRKIGHKDESWNTEKDLSKMKESVLLMYKCLKVQSFRYMDMMIDQDVIPVTGIVELVRDAATNSESGRSDYDSGNMLSPQYVSQIVNSEWGTLLADRISTLLDTHAMKFRLGENDVEARGRRRRDHKMFAMMLMGLMVMASILIPMGFQFLTVLGGKSLLMAKMALIMSAINGLKKIATSQVAYGLYHTAPDVHHDHGHHHPYGFHDKFDKFDKLFKHTRRDPPDFL